MRKGGSSVEVQSNPSFLTFSCGRCISAIQHFLCFAHTLLNVYQRVSRIYGTLARMQHTAYLLAVRMPEAIALSRGIAVC